MPVAALRVEQLDPRDPASALLYSLWRRYESAHHRERIATGSLGLLWVVGWTVLTVGAWRTDSASTPTNLFALMALTGWLAILPSLHGTLPALIIRYALLGAAVGFAIYVVLATSTRAAGVLIGAGSLFLATLAYRGLKQEHAARFPKLWSGILEGRRYLLLSDPAAFLWFVSHSGNVGVLLPATDAISTLERISPCDVQYVHRFCSECERLRAFPLTPSCPHCQATEVLLFYVTALEVQHVTGGG